MNNIFFTSDWHFNHDKDFVWKARGFSSIEEMNEAIIARHNSKVSSNDIVYCLGDLMLGDNEKGIECIKKLNGRIIVILGNHCTNNRIKAYENCPNIEKIVYADVLKYKKRVFYLSHYPTITANKGDAVGHCTLNLFGHTHQETNFYQDNPFMYHVGVDSHDCYPVHIDDIIESIKNKREEKGDLI